MSNKTSTQDPTALFHLRRDIPQDTLESMTRYSSIDTYHVLTDSGGLREELNHPLEDEDILVTEQIDGLNARVVVCPDDHVVIGSRKELLYATGDYLANPAHGMVAALYHQALRIQAVCHKWLQPDSLWVFYLEMFGGKKLTPASQDYSATGNVGFRLFDIQEIPNFREIVSWTPEQIATWCDHGEHAFATEDDLHGFAALADVQLTPRLATVVAERLPRTIAETHAWLDELLPTTYARLDDDARGRPEGVVLRTLDRRVIVKARLQNYRRTAQLLAKNSR